MSLRTAICNLLSHAVACCDKANKVRVIRKRFNSINQQKGFHERFYRHLFSWFIYPLPFETSGTASRGSIWYWTKDKVQTQASIGLSSLLRSISEVETRETSICSKNWSGFQLPIVRIQDPTTFEELRPICFPIKCNLPDLK